MKQQKEKFDLRSSKHHFEFLLLVLLVISLALVVWQNWGMNRIYELNPISNYKVLVIGDKDDGGKSKGSVEKKDSSWIFHFDITKDAPFPHCTFAIQTVNQNGRGLDLSNVDSVEVKIKYHGEGNGRIRFRLRNYDSSYVVEGNRFTYKYNEAAWVPERMSYPILLRRKDFQVPPWWTNRFNIPFEKTGRQLNDVRFVEVTTPSRIPPGQGSMEIISIRFLEKKVSAETLYFFLLSFWLLFLLGFLAYRVKNLRKERERERIYLDAVEKELALGKKIQKGFMPESLPNIENWEFHSVFLPAREMSGDFYDVFTIDENRVGFIIGDTSGKGVSAALFTAMVHTLLRAFSKKYQDLEEEILQSVNDTNQHIHLHRHQTTINIMFTTLFYGVIDCKTGKLRYVNGGHDQPVLKRKNGALEELGNSGGALGISPDFKYEVRETSLEAGDSLVLFTDGVLDARNSEKEGFSRAKIIEIIQKYIGSNPVNELREAVKSHIATADQFDDITMLSIFRK